MKFGLQKIFASVLLGLYVLGGDPVQHGSTFLRNDSGLQFEDIPLGIFGDDLILFQLLQSPSDDLGPSSLMFGGRAVGSDFTPIEVREESHTGSWPEVDFSSKSSYSVIDPVLIERG